MRCTCAVLLLAVLAVTAGCDARPVTSAEWVVDSTDEWQTSCQSSAALAFTEGMAEPTGQTATYASKLHSLKGKRSFQRIVVEQSPIWQNWNPTPNLGPSNLGDAPVMLVRGPKEYWLFGRYRRPRRKKGEPTAPFQAEDATLEGFNIPLKTTPFPNQYDAPGGLQPGKGGYHAWESRDMVNWVHHGPVTERFSCWVTSAERVDGKTYIYYDYPNDQDPHLYIDDDLTDGKPGKNMGIAFRDPSHGSDCTVIRDLQGNMHIIYEDWTPINARRHSWDSPLAGHAVSRDGDGSFRILAPAVDMRTRPTGETATYKHPHWNQHPDWTSNIAEYEVHEPEQNAFGDWAAISIGGRAYLFADYHPAGEKIRLGWFTSPDLNTPFTFCGELGLGHPDPDIGFAEGKFHLITQMKTDYVSPGPWVESVEVRVGVDTTADGTADTWTEWQAVSEQYELEEGFAKQVRRTPASVDLSHLPAGFGVRFELRLTDTTENASKPIVDRVRLTLE